jgi:hypothetical protein
MTENKFELQSYFILYLLFVRILNLSKDIVSFLHISNLFVRERTCYCHIEKYSNRIVHESKNPINNRTRTTFLD